MGSQKCGIVGKSQSVLTMINPIIFTRTCILCSLPNQLIWLLSTCVYIDVFVCLSIRHNHLRGSRRNCYARALALLEVQATAPALSTSTARAGTYPLPRSMCATPPVADSSDELSCTLYAGGQTHAGPSPEKSWR
jgi:hypothetical protein